MLGLFKYIRFFCVMWVGIVAAQQSVSGTTSFEIVIKECVIQTHKDDYKRLIDDICTNSFIAEKIVFTSDVFISNEELLYLTDLHEGTLVTPDMLKKAIRFLIIKEQFSTIKCSFKPTNNGMELYIDLQGFWIFKKLKIHGIWVGKEKYAHLYCLNSGDVFEDGKHTYSIEKIKQCLKNEGYWNATITGLFDRDFTNKQVKVHLHINRGSLFYVDAINILLSSSADTSFQVPILIQQFITNFLKEHLTSVVYSLDKVNRAIIELKKALEKQGYFDVTVEMQEKADTILKKIDLTFVIDIHQKKEFVFKGNHALSNEELLNTLSLFGRSFWMLSPTILEDELKSVYNKKGFWYSTISMDYQLERCVITINEGKRVALKRVIVKNAHYFDQVSLTNNVFKSLLKATWYDDQLIKKSLDDLEKLYKQAGFLEMKILKYTVLPIDEETQMLVIAIDEGLQFKLASVSIADYSYLESLWPFVSKSEETFPFNSDLLVAQRLWLINYFKKEGYDKIAVTPEIKRQADKIDLIWKIAKSKDKIRFGKTVFQGVNRFPIRQLFRELAYKQGDLLDKQSLSRSFLNLKSLNIFEHINIFPGITDDDSEQRPIIVRLKEDEPYEIRLRAGLELQNFTQQFSLSGLTYRLGGAFIVKSPFAMADQFRLDADFARGHRQVVAKYKRKWLFDTPFDIEFMGYTNAYAQPGFIGSPCNLYEVIQQGFLIGLTRKYGHFDGGITTGFEWLNTTMPDKSLKMCALIDSVAQAIRFDKRLLEQNIPFFYIEPSLFIDYLDQKLNPTQGAFTVLSVKGMFPMKQCNINSYIIKALVEQSFFMPIYSSVGALRIRFGHIFHRDFKAILPIERFYLGGANSMRGYLSDMAGPLGSFHDCNGKLMYAPIGGKSMVNFNAEIRFPLYKNLGGALFQDIGALSSCLFSDFTPRDILASTGFGLRLSSPVGSLRFDVGWKWTKYVSSDRRFAWFLTFGQAF